MQKYFLSVRQTLNPEISPKAYDTYGIGVRDSAEAGIDDISTRRAQVQSLVDLCNQLQLDPSHLMNVVEDFLYQL